MHLPYLTLELPARGMFSATLEFLSDGADYMVYLKRRGNRLAWSVHASAEALRELAERIPHEDPLIHITNLPVTVEVEEAENSPAPSNP